MPARAAADLIKQHRACQKEPDEHRPAVAHKDRRRVEIEDQKPDQSADQARTSAANSFVSPFAAKFERQRNGRDRRDAGGEAVHVIEQIDGVGDADQPKNGDPNIDQLISRERQLEPEDRR